MDSSNEYSGNINWDALREKAGFLSTPGIDPGSVLENDWKILDHTLNSLVADKDWDGILRLRRTFDALYANDSMTGLPALQQLDQFAIEAARRAENLLELAHLLGARGHNLHRQGFHKMAIEAFEESARLYRETGDIRQSLENYYMTSLCQRALGNREVAREILDEVLEHIPEDDLWRAHPLQVLAWVTQDSGDLATTESLLREALSLFRISKNSDLLIAGALADLGEVVGIQGRTLEARELFEESLFMFHAYKGQNNRQEARTALKFAELLMHQKDYQAVEKLLNQADDKIRGYGQYHDLLWQIELARAFVFLQTGRLSSCLFKLRSVFRIRRLLGLSNILLIQFTAKRYLQRLVQHLNK